MKKKTVKQKTVTRHDVSTIAMVNGKEKTISHVILEGVVMHWIGFGWVDEGAPTAKQRRDLPVVVD